MKQLQKLLAGTTSAGWLLVLVSACGGRAVALDAATDAADMPESTLESEPLVNEHATRLWNMGDHLLWTSTVWEYDNGALRGCRTSNCEESVIQYGAGAFPDSVSGSTTHLAFLFQSIHACPLEGCGAKPVDVYYPEGAFRLALDANAVYWMDGARDESVYRCPLSGCETPTAIASKQRANSDDIFVIGDEVYWRAYDELRRAKSDGSAPHELVLKHPDLDQFTLTEDRVYLVDKQQNVLYCKLADCAEPQVLVDTTTEKFALRADATGVFWLEKDNAVHSCAASGCESGPSPVTPKRAYAFAIDHDFVYWSERIPTADAKQRSPTMEFGAVGGNIWRSPR